MHARTGITFAVGNRFDFRGSSPSSLSLPLRIVTPIFPNRLFRKVASERHNRGERRKKNFSRGGKEERRKMLTRRLIKLVALAFILVPIRSSRLDSHPLTRHARNSVFSDHRDPSYNQFGAIARRFCYPLIIDFQSRG